MAARRGGQPRRVMRAVDVDGGRVRRGGLRHDRRRRPRLAFRGWDHLEPGRRPGVAGTTVRRRSGCSPSPPTSTGSSRGGWRARRREWLVGRLDVAGRRGTGRPRRGCRRSPAARSPVSHRGRPRAGRRAVGLPGQQPGRRLGQPPPMSRMGPRGPAAVALVSDLSLNDLLWVANTGHGPAGHWHARVRGEQADHDHLADPAAARAYLADHGVPVPPHPPDPASLARLPAGPRGDPAAPRAGRQPVDRGHDGAARRPQVPPRRPGPDRRRGRRLAGVRREPRARPDRPRRPARSPRPVWQPRLPADVPRRHAQPGAPMVRPDGLWQSRAGRPGARTDTVAGAGRHARRGSGPRSPVSPGSPAVQPPR